MEIFYLNDTKELPKLEPSSCVIGNFDGLHLGHQALIKSAFKDDLKTMVITFDGLIKNGKYLTKIDERIRLIEELNVDYLLVLNYPRMRLVFFNEFIKMLKKLKVKAITCGADFRFGFKCEGDTFDLQKNFNLTIFDYYTYHDLKVSTGDIKELLADGYLDEANRLLNRNYRISGKVFNGNKIGRTLGYPTANIDYESYFLPKNGVYVVKVLVRNEEYIGMANIGINPTLNKQEKTRLEVHILDFDQDIYDEEITVLFVKYLRGETRYSSKEALVNSLAETVKICRSYIK